MWFLGGVALGFGVGLLVTFALVSLCQTADSDARCWDWDWDARDDDERSAS